MLFPEFWFILPLSLLFFSLNLQAQDNFECDEIDLIYEIKDIGVFEMSSVICENSIFLPIGDLFNIMKIKTQISEDFETVSGFFIDQSAEYIINRPENKVIYNGKTYQLQSGDLIRTESNLYMRSEYFGEIFGLDCFFNFRSLKVNITSKLELPAIREMRLVEMRKNLGQLRGEMIADTVIGRTYPFFRFGMADWSVYSSQELKEGTDSRVSLGLGAMLAGGELTTALTYNSYTPFREKQQQYLWRYVDNDFRLVKQIMAGKISTQAFSTLFSPVIGVQLTNTPTTYRRSFGSYTLADRTEPGWIVELYVNNVLVDYMKADASGFFKFEIPLVYGNSVIRLKFYGPWGEEQIREQNINIPYNFLPEKSFEYKVSAGIVEDSTLSRFSRLSFNYGLSRNLTIGGGMEYMSSVSSGPLMPYLNASLNVLKSVLLSGEYIYGVKTSGVVSYRMPSNTNFEIEYTKYSPGQKAILFNYLEERKASLAFPYRRNKFSSYNRFTFHQIKMPASRYLNGELISSYSKYSSGEWLFSASFFGINTNLTTKALLVGDTDPNINSRLSMSVRLPRNFVIIPQVQYGFSRKDFYSARLGLEKRVRDKAYMNFSVERNFINSSVMAELGIRYNFRFAQAGTSVRNIDDNISFIEYARGSIINDAKMKYFGTSNQSSVGKGGIYFIPYLDVNGNGARDNGEPKVGGLDLRSSGGRIEKDLRDSSIRILGLEPYTKYYVELDQNSFDNISWRIPVNVLSIAIDPEIIKHVEIPVSVVGEASGTVSVKKSGVVSGLGRIVVTIYANSNIISAKTISEDDGYFSWFGLSPGDYYAMIDTSQLTRLGMISEPAIREFKIRPGQEGDIVDGLDFILKPVRSDKLAPELKEPEPVIRKDTTFLIVHEVVEELVTISKDSWAVQLGAFKNRTNAENLRKNLEGLLGRKVDIVIADGFFKVRINEIPERIEVDAIVEVLRDRGISELWIIGLKAKQQHIVLRERQDSVIRIIETRVEEPEIFESKIFMPFDENFYKLDKPRNRVVDQTVIGIMQQNSELKKMKFRDIRPNVRIIRTDTIDIHIPGQKGTVKTTGPAIPVRDKIIIEKVVPHFNIPNITKPVYKGISEENAPETVRVPKISLQVGVFYKRSEAVRAQKKIMSKLDVPVKIVEQWEYYRVIITGFHSREETFRYYPELAGLGFPGPTLIEE